MGNRQSHKMKSLCSTCNSHLAIMVFCCSPWEIPTKIHLRLSEKRHYSNWMIFLAYWVTLELESILRQSTLENDLLSPQFCITKPDQNGQKDHKESMCTQIGCPNKISIKSRCTNTFLWIKIIQYTKFLLSLCSITAILLLYCLMVALAVSYLHWSQDGSLMTYQRQ